MDTEFRARPCLNDPSLISYHTPVRRDRHVTYTRVSLRVDRAWTAGATAAWGLQRVRRPD